MHIFILGQQVAQTVCNIWSCTCLSGPTQGWPTRRILLPYFPDESMTVVYLIYWDVLVLQGVIQNFGYLISLDSQLCPIYAVSQGSFQFFNISEVFGWGSKILWGNLWALSAPLGLRFRSDNIVVSLLSPGCLVHLADIRRWRSP